MKLEKLKLVELSAQEVQEVQGGMGYNCMGNNVATGAGSAGAKYILHNVGDFFRGFLNL